MDLPKKHKTTMIWTWKKSGVIHDDFDILYEEYINTFNCNHCGKEFKKRIDRCLDHDHESGLFRKIVCQSCNNSDNYIKYPNGIPSLNERRKKYREDNKQKEIDRRKKYRTENKDKLTETTECPCGGKYQHNNKVHHFKTKKHIVYTDSIE